MNRIAITLLAALTVGATQAGYTLIIPLEQSHGGALPNGSINITSRTPGLPVENWQPAEPLYGNWINYGTYFGCDNEKWEGEKAPYSRYRATNSTCKLNQTRTVQNREIEQTTLVYRNVGAESMETRTLTNQTFVNIGECVYSFDPSNPDYSNASFWTELLPGNGFNTYYITMQGTIFNEIITKELTSYYSNTRSAVYFKGDAKLENILHSGSYHYHELCYIRI
ncbi:MAG: hypothetical protein ACOKSU_20625 [Pseudomonas sp.]|uniref:hypothetical protein n=1 Tax=Pseudomonas TaxID=286 RepID=UPI0011DD36EB|nr:hypothetical protein [Pseudomonas sp. VLB120]